jgi:DNA repair exonuclease SbcCD ATPase subunit
VNNRDNFAMDVDDLKNLRGSFILGEKGHYQFSVKPPAGEKVLLKEKYTIELEQDKSPQVILFPVNPKPVYYETDSVQMFYEAHDDYGIHQINLIAQINDTTLTKSIKRFKQPEKDTTGNFSWSLSLESLQAGDKVQYFLEIQDNDNVTGPNTGQSEIYSFIIFDSRKEQENLVRLQEELSEKMIALLANGLVEGEVLKATTTNALYGKKLLASHADALIDIIGLAQRIKNQAKDFDSFPQPYLTLLNSIINGLTAIREDQIDTLNKIQGTILKHTPASFTIGSIEILNGRMVAHLEQDILYLIKMTNRQKMDQVMDLENQLSQLTQALQEEFENIRDKKSPLTPNQLKSKLNEIQQTLQKMMDKLSRQNQSSPDEFLNSKAHKSMNMDETMASLEKIKDLANQGKMEEALEQLKKVAEDLRELANQLDQAKSSMDSLVDNQVMEQINESVAKLESLEKKQKQVLESTSEINQKLRANQAKQFDSLIKSFFDALKNDVTAIQNILEEDSKYLDEHKAMIKMRELMQEEAAIRQKIKALSQKTIDSSLDEDLGDNFKELNEARKELSKPVIELDNLRTQGFREFKENLPQIKKRYETLKELTELNDLNEFNVLFKNTYPEIFRWQGSMRTNRNQREDISDRLSQDLREVTRLNSEISKKLGSLKRSIEKDSQSLLTDKEKTKLDQLAKQEQGMSQQTKELESLFNEMNQENPRLPPALSRNMGDAQRNLKNAQERLQAQQVQRGIDSENRALKSIQKTKKLLNEIKNSGTQMSDKGKRDTPLRLETGSRRDSRRGGSVRMQKEKVLLPSEDQYKVPSAFREDILDAMKKQTPKNYERLVNEYYKELVQ